MSHVPALASPRRKIFSSVGLALALLASLVAFAPTASAHHPEISASAACDPLTGDYVVNWTTTSWSPGTLSGTHGDVRVRYTTDPGATSGLSATGWSSPAFTGQFTAAQPSFGGTFTVPGNTTHLRVRSVAVGPWANGQGGNEIRTTSVALNGDCEQDLCEWNPQLPAGDPNCNEPTWSVKVWKHLAEGTEDGVVDDEADFEINIVCVDDEDSVVYEDSKWVKVGEYVKFSGIPIGAECTISETAPSGGLGAGWTWNAPTYPDGTDASDGDCYIIYTRSSESRCTVHLSVENSPGRTTTTTTPTTIVTTTTPEETTTTTTPEETTTTTEATTTTAADEQILGIGVEAGGAAAGGGVLPRTGGASGAYVLVASLLLGLGAIFRTAGRRMS